MFKSISRQKQNNESENNGDENQKKNRNPFVLPANKEVRVKDLQLVFFSFCFTVKFKCCKALPPTDIYISFGDSKDEQQSVVSQCSSVSV